MSRPTVARERPMADERNKLAVAGTDVAVLRKAQSRRATAIRAAARHLYIAIGSFSPLSAPSLSPIGLALQFEIVYRRFYRQLYRLYQRTFDDIMGLKGQSATDSGRLRATYRSHRPRSGSPPPRAGVGTGHSRLGIALLPACGQTDAAELTRKLIFTRNNQTCRKDKSS